MWEVITNNQWNINTNIICPINKELSKYYLQSYYIIIIFTIKYFIEEKVKTITKQNNNNNVQKLKQTFLKKIQNAQNYLKYLLEQHIL